MAVRPGILAPAGRGGSPGAMDDRGGPKLPRPAHREFCRLRRGDRPLLPKDLSHLGGGAPGDPWTRRFAGPPRPHKGYGQGPAGRVSFLSGPPPGVGAGTHERHYGRWSSLPHDTGGPPGAMQWAVWWRYRRWHGIPFGTWCGYFGGRSVVPVEAARPPFWRYNLPMRQILFSGYHMSEGNLGAYAAELRRRQPPWLHGYPSLLALLAAFLLDQGMDLGYTPRWVTVGAENLLRHQVEVMERAFGIRPRQHYGLAEGVANLSECEAGQLHVDEDFAAVEFLPDEASGACRIVGTNLTNLAMPFVRYDTGDLATAELGPCPCGRPGRVVLAVDGRQEDYIVLPNGARVGRLDHVFKDLTAVREAQILQLADGALRVALVPRTGFGRRDEMRVVDELRKRVGSQIQIVVELTTTLRRGPTGKLRFVVLELADGTAASVMRPDSPPRT